MGFFKKSQEERPSIPQELLDLRSAIDSAALPEHVESVAAKGTGQAREDRSISGRVFYWIELH